MTMRRLLTASALASTLAFYPAVAAAQAATTDTPVQTSEGADEQANAATDPTTEQAATQRDGEIVITGSRLARPNLDSPAPVTSVTSELLTSTGNLSMATRSTNFPHSARATVRRIRPASSALLA